MGDAAAARETQWMKGGGAAHAALAPEKKAEAGFIAAALRAAALGFHGRGSARKSISGAAVWRGSKKGH